MSENMSKTGFINNVLFRRVKQIQWSITKQQNNGRAYKTKI